jgi:hypothetical protein
MGMNPYQKIKGIINDVFGFSGGEGVVLKDNAEILEVYESDGVTLTNARGKDPLVAQDFVTLNYFDTTPQAGDSHWVEIPIKHGDQGTNVDSTFVAAVGGRVLQVKVDVTEAFDAECNFTVGDTGDADRFVIAGDVKEKKIDLYEFPQYTDTIASVFRVAVPAAVLTTGEARILIEYAVPDV